MIGEKISVVIAVYNCESYVGEAIESVLAQSIPVNEVIVVNDGSTDNTRQVLEQYSSRISIIDQDNQGCSVARNRGVQASTGDYISFLDSDDVWAADKLEIQLECFGRDPELDMVFGHLKNFISPELGALERELISCPSQVFRCELPNIVLVKREAFYRVGEYEPSFKKAEGIDWYTRALDAGLKMEFPQQVLYYRRLFKLPRSSQNVEDMSDYARVVKRMLDRRRAGKGVVNG